MKRIELNSITAKGSSVLLRTEAQNVEGWANYVVGADNLIYEDSKNLDEDIRLLVLKISGNHVAKSQLKQAALVIKKLFPYKTGKVRINRWDDLDKKTIPNPDCSVVLLKNFLLM